MNIESKLTKLIERYILKSYPDVEDVEVNTIDSNELSFKISIFFKITNLPEGPIGRMEVKQNIINDVSSTFNLDDWRFLFYIRYCHGDRCSDVIF